MDKKWAKKSLLLKWLFLIFTFQIACVTVASDHQSTSNKLAPKELFRMHQKQLQELRTLANDGGHPSPEVITKFDPDVCYTYSCIEAAKEFLLATNFRESPCEKGSWLKYACVRRTQQTTESNDNELDDMHHQSQVGYLGSVAIGQTLALLESTNVDSPIMKKAITYYQQCETWSQDTPNNGKINMIIGYLKQFGDWPLLTNKNSPGDNFDWTSLLANNVRIAVAYGVAPYLFDIFIEEGDVPLLFTGELSLHKNNAEIVEIIKLLSKGKRRVSENDPQIKEMREFTSKLTLPSEDRIETFQLKNISKHHNFGPDFNLQDFYSEMLAGTRVRVTKDSYVATDLNWLVQQVKSINEAEPRVIANILFLQAAAALLTRLTTLTHGEHLPALKKYRSEGPMDCIRETYEKFDYALSHEYLHRYYDHNGTSTLVQLMDNLKRGYVKVIETANFLTPETKALATNKAKDIHTFIAADAWVMDEKKLEDYYKKMNISEDKNFVQNHVAGLRFHWAKFLELTNANIFSYLVGDAYTGYVSAKYSYHFNQIRIQAALAQKPLFSSKYPGFTNYGGIGTVLAHALGHSFDTNGVHFDKRGHRGNFWDDLSYEGYYNWTDSLTAAYNGPEYKTPDPWGSLADASIDHSQTVNDDIADIVGVHMAYNAYKIYLRNLKNSGEKEKVLPGLKQFTPQQLFWMKYALMWCEHTEKSYLHVLRHFNQHSPGNIRATLPLTKSAEWAKDFRCAPPKTPVFSSTSRVPPRGA